MQGKVLALLVLALVSAHALDLEEAMDLTDAEYEMLDHLTEDFTACLLAGVAPGVPKGTSAFRAAPLVFNRNKKIQVAFNGDKNAFLKWVSSGRPAGLKPVKGTNGEVFKVITWFKRVGTPSKNCIAKPKCRNVVKRQCTRLVRAARCTKNVRSGCGVAAANSLRKLGNRVVNQLKKVTQKNQALVAATVRKAFGGIKKIANKTGKKAAAAAAPKKGNKKPAAAPKKNGKKPAPAARKAPTPAQVLRDERLASRKILREAKARAQAEVKKRLQAAIAASRKSALKAKNALLRARAQAKRAIAAAAHRRAAQAKKLAAAAKVAQEAARRAQVQNQLASVIGANAAKAAVAAASTTPQAPPAPTDAEAQIARMVAAAVHRAQAADRRKLADYEAHARRLQALAKKLQGDVSDEVARRVKAVIAAKAAAEVSAHGHTAPRFSAVVKAEAIKQLKATAKALPKGSPQRKRLFRKIRILKRKVRAAKKRAAVRRLRRAARNWNVSLADRIRRLQKLIPTLPFGSARRNRAEFRLKRLQNWAAAQVKKRAAAIAARQARIAKRRRFLNKVRRIAALRAKRLAALRAARDARLRRLQDRRNRRALLNARRRTRRNRRFLTRRARLARARAAAAERRRRAALANTEERRLKAMLKAKLDLIARSGQSFLIKLANRIRKGRRVNQRRRLLRRDARNLLRRRRRGRKSHRRRRAHRRRKAVPARSS